MSEYPISIRKVSRTMGLREGMSGLADLISRIERGLPRTVVTAIVAEAVPESRSDLRQMIATLIEPSFFDRPSETLSTEASERAERLARITALAHEAWNRTHEAREWLTDPHCLLSNRMPIAVAVSDLGARSVEHILRRDPRHKSWARHVTSSLSRDFGQSP